MTESPEKPAKTPIDSSTGTVTAASPDLPDLLHAQGGRAHEVLALAHLAACNDLREPRLGERLRDLGWYALLVATALMAASCAWFGDLGLAGIAFVVAALVGGFALHRQLMCTFFAHPANEGISAGDRGHIEWVAATGRPLDIFGAGLPLAAGVSFGLYAFAAGSWHLAIAAGTAFLIVPIGIVKLALEPYFSGVSVWQVARDLLLGRSLWRVVLPRLARKPGLAQAAILVLLAALQAGLLGMLLPLGALLLFPVLSLLVRELAHTVPALVGLAIGWHSRFEDTEAPQSFTEESLEIASRHLSSAEGWEALRRLQLDRTPRRAILQGTDARLANDS